MLLLHHRTSTTMDRVIIADRIRGMREEKKLSQGDIEKRTGWDGTFPALKMNPKVVCDLLKMQRFSWNMNPQYTACRSNREPHTKITRITGWRLHYCVPRVMGGSTGATNCVLLHPECHDRVHRQRLPVSKPRLLQRGVRRA